MSGVKLLLDNYVVWSAMVEKNCRQTGNRPKASTKNDKWFGKLDLHREVEMVCLVQKTEDWWETEQSVKV